MLINKRNDLGLSIDAIRNIILAEILIASNSIRSIAVYSGGIPTVINVEAVLKSDADVCANFNVLTVA